jgi:hypothetical protein
MNYFLSDFFHDRKIYVGIGLAALAALNIMDIISFMLGQGFFKLWVVKITVGAALAGGIVYGFFLRRQDKKSRQLESLLPAFLSERRAYFEEMAARDPDFQTFCHECRHYAAGPRRCLLRLHGRKVRIRLNNESQITHCLYWNLGDMHPVLALTDRVKEAKEEWERVAGEDPKKR